MDVLWTKDVLVDESAVHVQKMVICTKGFMIAATGDKSRQADKLFALDSQGGFDL